MTDEQVLAWAAQFEKEHGYLPNKDPQFLALGEAKGWSEDYAQGQALQEHMDALKWGQEFQAMTGKKPTEHDYRYRWFGGFTPENEGWPDWLGPKPKPPAPPKPATGLMNTNAFRSSRNVPPNPYYF